MGRRATRREDVLWMVFDSCSELFSNTFLRTYQLYQYAPGIYVRYGYVWYGVQISLYIPVPGIIIEYCAGTSTVLVYRVYTERFRFWFSTVCTRRRQLLLLLVNLTAIWVLPFMNACIPSPGRGPRGMLMHPYLARVMVANTDCTEANS